MGLFAKNTKFAGWMSIGFYDDGITAAYIKRLPAAMPVVEYAAYYPVGKSSITAAMEKLVKELHATRHQCTSLLNAGEYQLLSVDAPNVPAEELKTAIRWRLKDMLDFHVDDATIDVLDVPVDKDAPVRTHSMYAVAARNNVIKQRQALFEKTKIPLKVIDIPEMAQRNISALLEQDARGMAVLSFDASGGLLTITFSSELYLARRIDVTLQQLQQAEGEQKNVFYDRITLELQRSLDHFDRQYRFIAISKLMLSPIGEAGSALQEHLAANLYVPVEIVMLETILDISKVPELRQLENQQRFFLTLGAALRHEEIAL